MLHPAIRRATTASLIRQLERVHGARPRQRVGRIPHPTQPTRIEDAYTEALQRHVCGRARAAFERVAPEILRALALHRQQLGHTDAKQGPTISDFESALISALAGKLGRVVAQGVVEVLADVLAGVALVVGLPEIMAVVLAVAAEMGLAFAADRIARAFVEEAMAPHRKRDAAGDEGDEEMGRRIGAEAARRIRALHGAGVVAQEAGGFNIGMGRAAQLGEAAREQEERQRRARAGQVGTELRRATAQGDLASRLIDQAARDFVAQFDPVALKQIVDQFGNRTDLHARLQLDQQLRSAIGVPLSAIERPTRDRIEGWVALNVDLIRPTRVAPYAEPIGGNRTLVDRYFDRLQLDVQDAFSGATHPSTLAELFEERYQMSERDAERIARDQVLKLNADVTHDRMESLGVEEATWHTVNDGRVCKVCRALAGRTFRLDQGINGILPGNCHPQDRCYSVPKLDVLLGR